MMAKVFFWPSSDRSDASLYVYLQLDKGIL